MLKIIKAILCLLFTAIYDYFAWLLKFCKHPEKTPLEVRYAKCRKLVRKANKVLGVEVNIIGKENIPDEVSCFYGNHLSVIDPLSMFEVFDKPVAFVGKKELEKYPIVGKVFKACNGLFLDRKNLKQELRIMMKVEDELKNKRSNIFIFPEGTRNKDQQCNLLTIHKGSFRSSMKAGVPIVPIVCYGTFRVLNFKYSQKRCPVTIKILKPIMPSDYASKTTEEVAKEVSEVIQRELTFNIRKIDFEANQKLGYKKIASNTLYQ